MSESTGDRNSSRSRPGSVRVARSEVGVAQRAGFRSFIHVLLNTALANVTTSFLWFALTFWVYAETRNVIATGVIGGAYMLFVSLFSMFFGTLVDRFRKKVVMLSATLLALAVFILDSLFFFGIGEDRILDLTRPWFWIFAVVMLVGAVVEQLRNIALSTTVTLLVPAERRANANGLVGTVQGLAMLVTSVFSGLSVGFLGMGWTLVIGVVALALTAIHLAALSIPEPAIVLAEGQTKWVDVRGGWLAVIAALIGVVGALFTIREWGWLFIVGIWVIMALFPVVEAAEQTVIQRLVPYESQGRVFGFAMTFEAATAPITALLIAPIAQVWIIPHLATSAGEQQWAWLVGTGGSRGIALVLVIAGIGCFLLAIAAFLSPQYRMLSRQYSAANS